MYFFALQQLSTAVMKINGRTILPKKFNRCILYILYKFIKTYLYSMTENQYQILSAAQNYATDLYQTKVSKSIHFHTLLHTQEVLAASEKMAEYYQLADEDRFALALAAWFHDTGYSGGTAKGHEELSIELALKFLNEHKAGQAVIDKVKGCINATRIPQSPNNLIEQIICDADLFHLGTGDFKEKNRLLREELNDFGGQDLSKKDWRKLNIEFLEKHTYFTSFAKENLQPLKTVYLQELKDKRIMEEKPGKKNSKKGEIPELVKHKDKGKEKNKEAGITEDEEKKLADVKKKKEKESQSERAVSTVFRIVAQSQNNLSQMADSKSNILISVNAIILSIMISSIFEKLKTDAYLQVPFTILVTICVLSMVFAILATRPTVTSGTFTKDDIAAKKTNLLFFGNFHKMGLPDYDWAMTELLADKNYLYSSMIKDTYFLGIVLAKKYKYLRIAYNIFMFGLIASMIAFTVAFLAPGATEMYQ
ncbi:MAG: HD domain-containing protein [Bacteroidetes bacterium]|nr:MAG: HD domain-containing protein [Bacteroidota bacterium]